MKTKIILSVMVFSSLTYSSFVGYAQTNLVPNYSFELYDTCPNSEDQIQFATGWSKYSTPVTTPDYYNACAPSGFFNVPNSGNGYQAEHRNCSAFAGLVTWGPTTPSNNREHIGTQLSQPLIIGQKYFISFYTVMCESVLGSNYGGMPSNKIGLRFSTTAYSSDNPTPINNFAHLYSSAIINDSINWIRISGSIVADSAYNYLMVGNFFDDANTDTMHYSCSSCLNFLSYYYIDDICVSTDSLLCNGGVDFLPCTVGLNENILNDINVFPNPFSDFINISLQSNQNIEIMLYDILGRTILEKNVYNENDIRIDLSNFSSGTYLIKISNKNNLFSLIKKLHKS